MTRHEQAFARFAADRAMPDNTIAREAVEEALATFPNRNERLALRVVAMREPDGVQFWFHCVPTTSEDDTIDATSRFDTVSPCAKVDGLTGAEVEEVRDAIAKRGLTLREVKQGGLQFDWSFGTPPHLTSQAYIPASEHFFFFVIIIKENKQ